MHESCSIVTRNSCTLLCGSSFRGWPWYTATAKLSGLPRCLGFGVLQEQQDSGSMRVSIGPSTKTSPYILPSHSSVHFASVITVGDALAGGGVFAGKTDGTGAFDNGDGTFTVLVNHELTGTSGLVRDHGSVGAFVDRLVIDKATLEVVSADDLIQTVNVWNDATDRYVIQTTAFDRLCSGDLALPTAFYNAASGLGTSERIYLTGEESGVDGRAFATIVTGSEAGAAYELPNFGNMSFENEVANPLAQDKTIVAMTNDADDGQIYFYVGDKQASGTAIEEAGLIAGSLFGLRVSGVLNESDAASVSGSFVLEAIGPGGDARNLTGDQIESQSDADGVTGFLRPEDCAWDPDHPNVLYFTTTNSFDGNSRLYQATFTDITNPQLGGTIKAVLDGSEGQREFDGITVANGKVVLQEDPGDHAYAAKIWEYDIASDSLTQLAQFNPAIVTSGGSGFITQNEESSGLLDVTYLLGDSDTRAYLVDAQLHEATGDPSTVEEGQLMIMYVEDGADPPPPPPPPPPAVLLGGPGEDRLQGTGSNETLRSYDGSDVVYAGSGNDIVWGGAGADQIFGEAGDDELHGGPGNDRVDGGDGNDDIFGGRGADLVSGGAGNDNFIFKSVDQIGSQIARDTIDDFVAGEDHIDLHLLDANHDAPANQRFGFVIDPSTTVVKNSITWFQDAEHGVTIVQGDVDGDAVADFQIEMTGLMNLSAEDFLL